MVRRFPKATLALAALAAAGCGGGGESRPESSNNVVDASADPPYVASLAVNPRDGSLLMATNAGTYAVAPGSSTLRRVKVRVRAGGRSGPASKGLAFNFTGPDALVGSGHPGSGDGAPAPLLGFIRSSDGGRTWRSVSELGQADLHAVDAVRDTVVAADGSEAKVLVSTDRGRTFEFRAAPLRLTDLAVNPSDANQLVGSTERGMHTSSDGGRSWKPGETVPGSRFAWPEPELLFRVDPGGAVMRSSDAGASWTRVGEVDGESQALAATGGRDLYVADIDGNIRESGDGGRSWKLRARAPGA